jgi:hypothetical protein
MSIEATTKTATTHIKTHTLIAILQGNSAMGRSRGKAVAVYGEGRPRFAGNVPSALSLRRKRGPGDTGHRSLRVEGAYGSWPESQAWVCT